jgi:hypothetical protein
MPDLNEMVLPVVWTMARRALTEGPVGREDLIELLTPTGLIGRRGVTTSRHVRPSIAELERLEVVVGGDDGPLRLADPTLDDARFRMAIASRLLSVPEDADLWAERGETGLEHHVEVGVAWLCLQGLEANLTSYSGAAEPLLIAQLGGNRRLLRDVAPYSTLERTVRWLGIADYVGSALLPDPTALVRVALDEWLPPATQRPLREIVDQAAITFPWMPHGRMGRGVAERLTSVGDDSAESGRCPQCLTLALLRLEFEGLIELMAGDDPNERVALALPGGDERAIARVVRR